MAEFVKKTALGGYKPVAGGPRDTECTHVILTLGEYDGLKREISSAQQAAKNAEYNADKKIHQIQSEAQSRITDAEKKIAKNTAEWEKKLAAEQQESALQRELNANLLRITKERANAERGLKPKKEHNGYVVLTSVEKESRYKDSFGHPRTITLWETAMETPYTVDFEAEQVRSLLQELFQEDEDERWPICRIGITGNYPGKYADMIQDKEWREDYEKYNVMLERWLRANYRRGYWELVFLHTKPLSVIPSLLAVRPCAEYRNPPVRTNRGSLFFPTAGTFRPRLGSMEFGFCGLRSVGRYGADRPSPAFSCAALYFCYSNKVCSARMPQRTGTNTAANMTRKADI